MWQISGNVAPSKPAATVTSGSDTPQCTAAVITAAAGTSRKLAMLANNTKPEREATCFAAADSRQKRRLAREPSAMPSR